jgi:hypothetical protein
VTEVGADVRFVERIKPESTAFEIAVGLHGLCDYQVRMPCRKKKAILAIEGLAGKVYHDAMHHFGGVWPRYGTLLGDSLDCYDLYYGRPRYSWPPYCS